MELSKQEMELYLPFPVIGSKNFILQKYLQLVLGFQNGFQKQEMELCKQEMELFLPFPVIGSKNLFNKSISNWSKDSKISKTTKTPLWNLQRPPRL